MSLRQTVSRGRRRGMVECERPRLSISRSAASSGWPGRPGIIVRRVNRPVTFPQAVPVCWRSCAERAGLWTTNALSASSPGGAAIASTTTQKTTEPPPSGL